MAPPTPADAEPALTIIERRRGWAAFGVGDLWRHGDLLSFLVWRDLKVRYRQTALGALWALLQPLATMTVFWAVFARFGGLSTDGASPALFYLSTLVPWTYFASAVNAGGASLVANERLLSKVYFPRVVIPLAATITPLVDLAIGLVLLVGVELALGVPPGRGLAALPLAVLLAAGTALAASLWTSALNVTYRDVRHALPFAVQLLFFASPVVYPLSMVPERWRAIYSLNPMVGVIELFRWTTTGQGLPWPAVGVGALVALAASAGGLFYFRSMERTFADVI